VIVPEELRQDSDGAQWSTILFDNFTSNEDNNWLVGSQTSEYFDPVNRVIADGRYRWDAKVNKASAFQRSGWGIFRSPIFT